MINLWVAFATALINAARERMALARMRAELEVDEAEKKKAINEGLSVFDKIHDLVEWVKGRIADDKDEAKS